MSDSPDDVTPQPESAETAGPPAGERLEAEPIRAALRALPAWTLVAGGTAIHRCWQVPGLWVGTCLATGLAAAVETEQHEATFTVTARTPEVTLSTPAAGGVTAKDLQVAAVLEF